MKVMRFVRRASPGLLVLLAASLAACATDPVEPAPEGSGGNGSGGGALGAGGIFGSGGGSSVSRPKERTRAARLTHEQYKNTVRDLFGFEEDYSTTFAPDALNGFSFDTSVDLVVDSRLVGQYRTAAEAIAERVAGSETALVNLVPCDDDSPACRDEFIQSFGKKAFRRPLTDAEQGRFAALFDAAHELVLGEDAFVDGVRLVVEATLVTPNFLYRSELQTQENAEGRVELTSYELASRLSYFLYGSMPDAPLFAAAEAGTLGDEAGLRAELERILALDRTRDHLIHFQEQSFQFGRYARIGPDPEAFPDAPADLKDRALTASRLFLRDVMEEGGGLTELLNAPFAYVDATLAPLYGVAVSGDFERVEFPDQDRPGLLTQIGFLASHAYAKKTDPIHRGLFVVRDLLCQKILDPPPEASQTTIPPGTPKPKTTREEVDLLTLQDGCSLCHAIINPPGFAFEGFDAVGQVRVSEDGSPVITTGSLVIDGQEVAFSGAAELLGALGRSREADRCYVGKLAQFAHGRELSGAELDLVSQIPTHLSIRDLVLAIASDESFVTRAPTEVTP